MQRDVFDLIGEETSEKTGKDLIAEFMENPEPRVPCLLLIDISHSMRGDPMAELNGGLQSFPPSLAEDSLAAKRTETAILTFGGEPRLAHDFATLSNLRIPELMAGGGTPMSAAIIRGLELIEKRKAIYRKNRIKCYMPWIFLLTDGAPTDPELWPQAVNQVKAGLARDAFQLLGVGVGKDADMAKLEELTPTTARLQGLQFGNFFRFVSTLQIQRSQSQPGDRITVARPDCFEFKN